MDLTRITDTSHEESRNRKKGLLHRVEKALFVFARSCLDYSVVLLLVAVVALPERRVLFAFLVRILVAILAVHVECKLELLRIALALV